ncbi:MAG: TIM-barrel domain-containing protein, partial [Limisphaerales bacterium]
MAVTQCTHLSGNLTRLQAARRRREFTDDSWMVIDRGEPCPEAIDGVPLPNIQLAEEGISFSVTLEPEDLVFGLGQGTGSLNRRDTRKDIWNIDVLGHASCIHPNLRSLYQSIPLAIVLRHGRAMGYFWDYAGRQAWDFTESQLHASSPTKSLDLYLFHGPTIAAILDRFTQLTGRPALPPRWALGYQQSRYSYASREELESIASELRERKIPCDALYLDIDHLDDYRVFTFGDSFPKPRQMLKQLQDEGFKVSAIVDPGVKNDSKFDVLKRGKATKAFVRKPNGRSDYVGNVW